MTDFLTPSDSYRRRFGAYEVSYEQALTPSVALITEEDEEREGNCLKRSFSLQAEQVQRLFSIECEYFMAVVKMKIGRRIIIDEHPMNSPGLHLASLNRMMRWHPVIMQPGETLNMTLSCNTGAQTLVKQAPIRVLFFRMD